MAGEVDRAGSRHRAIPERRKQDVESSRRSFSRTERPPAVGAAVSEPRGEDRARSEVGLSSRNGSRDGAGVGRYVVLSGRCAREPSRASSQASLLRTALVAVLVAVGCSPADSPATDAGCGRPFIGDAGASIEVVPGVAADGAFVELNDGDALPLVAPPQGGHVSFVAVRVRNIDTCSVRLTARLRSQTTGLIAGQDARDITVVEQPDGWAMPNVADVSNVANVPLCPDYFEESIVDVPHTLEVMVQDARGARAEGKVQRTVVPRCQQTNAAESAGCRCECTGGYTLGRCANVVLDAGGG